jgi:hypothetical protein
MDNFHLMQVVWFCDVNLRSWFNDLCIVRTRSEERFMNCNIIVMIYLLGCLDKGYTKLMHSRLQFKLTTPGGGTPLFFGWFTCALKGKPVGGGLAPSFITAIGQKFNDAISMLI